MKNRMEIFVRLPAEGISEVNNRLSSLWWLPLGSVREVTPEKLKSWLDDGRPVQLVDARTELEYHNGTISGAIFAPLTGMPSSIERIDLNPDVAVVALCLSGHRSRPAVRWLRSKGVEAYSLKGGVTAWKLKGFPVEKPAHAMK